MLFAMEAAALRNLLAPYVSPAEVNDQLLHQIRIHLDLLQRWNQRMNLTALRTPEVMIERHFGESLFAARQLCRHDERLTMMDVGSGAGFPGLPVKYWAPDIELTLIEGHGKKATFLRELGRALRLSGLSVVHARAESLSAASADLVTLRAVEQFEQVLPSAARLVAPGGRLALLIGEAQRERALALLAQGESSTVPLPGSQQRILLTWRRD